MWVRSLGQEDHMEWAMTTHSKTVAWKISWTEELGRLESKGLQRVGQSTYRMSLRGLNLWVEIPQNFVLFYHISKAC